MAPISTVRRDGTDRYRLEETDMLDSPPDARWRSHAALLAAGTFAVGTDGFVIAGLLPTIGESLQVRIGQAGQPRDAPSAGHRLRTGLRELRTAGGCARRRSAAAHRGAHGAPGARRGQR